ncbi:cupin domain-containing protein [Microlunatus ginsengisoli]|uniref:cupin domain-containing protein n=1 Tax=Microlunatus ginsengisoli TaxID=363863 RepID=UPI0031CFCE70
MSHYRPSTADVARLSDSLTDDAAALTFEPFRDESARYLEELIPKPWGHEFRVYSDDLYDVWKLCLRPGQSTSVHCHPRKETALLCLDGTARMHLLDRTVDVVAGDVSHIGKGVFHGTANVGSGPLHLVEVELPRNKFDLVRLSDRYGRRGTGYETEPGRAPVALRSGRLVARSSVRTGVALDGFSFDVRAGLDLISRPLAGLLFAVGLDIAAALQHRIEVLGPDDLTERGGHEQLYLTIVRADPTTTRTPATRTPTTRKKD